MESLYFSDAFTCTGNSLGRIPKLPKSCYSALINNWSTTSCINSWHPSFSHFAEEPGFWKISRSQIYSNLQSYNLDDITEITVFFHDNGELAPENEFRNLRYQVSKLNFHAEYSKTVHPISEFGIHNYTFFQTRFRYTKNGAGTNHIKHWLANSRHSYLYLTIRQLGESDHRRFTTSSVRPIIFLTKKNRASTQPFVGRRRRNANTDGSTITSRFCEDTPAGYTGCCRQRREIILSQTYPDITIITDLPNGPIAIRECRGSCAPGKYLLPFNLQVICEYFTFLQGQCNLQLLTW